MTEKKTAAPQVAFDVSCNECGCDVLLPLMKLVSFKSFSGNRIQVEWPSRNNDDEFARVACPSCGLIMVVHADGRTNPSDYRLFSKGGKRKRAKTGV